MNQKSEIYQPHVKKDRISLKKMYFIKEQVKNWQYAETIKLKDKNNWY